ncbi:hypothetical protein Pmani_015500 [Petrolisthes manimaculis]|uniref:Papilin n=1 Tax=Petrolisthes manimaculis TaxID=1843537 RepID=A0AAE1U7B1_9EUCA|nr:hypothetical protein Pmani_015500 [Petrolisthes manimaculis]
MNGSGMDEDKAGIRWCWRTLIIAILLAAILVECLGEVSLHPHHHRRHQNNHHHRRRHQHNIRQHSRRIPILVDEEQEARELAVQRAWSRDKRQQYFGDQRGQAERGQSREEPERGPWGEWSGPSPCSRSCGGGVNYRSRSCLGSAEECTGRTKKYESCNIQSCPEGSSDYRTEQCQRHNSVPFEGKYYRWVPHLKALNKCELNCQPEGERFYYRHAMKVVDGTRCGDEGFDICVDGKCMPVGCDRMLGSSLREDKCRVCGGDSSTCNTVTGDFMQRTLTVGYNDIILVPAGATNIYVEEMRATNNYIAVRNQTGHFYLNGNWRIDFPRARHFAGTTFHYERKATGIEIFAPEILRALGPTTEPLHIVLLYQETNLGISYEYSVPKEVTQAEAETYDWIFGTYSECSVECGGGHMTRNVTCARTSDFQAVAENLCDPRLQPESNKTCNDRACPARWQEGEWTPCTSSCGTPGWQFRHVYCGQTFSEGRLSVVNESMCMYELGPRPSTVQECNRDATCATWHVGDWAPCNKLCGVGRQFRKVTCHVMESGQTRVLEDEACTEEKPDTEKPCERIPCTGVDWVSSDWSGCGSGCGLTNETRSALCVSQKGKVVEDEYCSQIRKPQTSQPCVDATECEFRWYASEWSACSVDCGEGVQTRDVLCGVWESGSVSSVEDVNCDSEKRFSESQPCNGTGNCDGKWFAGPWSECDKKCGGGTQHRKIFCYMGTKLATAVQCDGNIIPYSIDSCNNHPCSNDEVMGEDLDIVSEDDECDYEEDSDDTMTEAPGDITSTSKVTGFTGSNTPDSLFSTSLDGHTKDASSTQDFLNDGTSTPDGSLSTSFGQTTLEDLNDGTTTHDSSFSTSDFTSDNVRTTLDSLTVSVDNPIGSTDGDMMTTALQEEELWTATSDVTQSDEATEEGSGWSPTGGYGTGLMGWLGSTLGLTSDDLTTTAEEETSTVAVLKKKEDKKKKKRRKCQPKTPPPQKDCKESDFGCCQDGVTLASGPFQKGCPRIETCEDTPHGCCPDKLTPADGAEGKGCPGMGVCENSLFGCCKDGVTEATGPDDEGCEDLLPYDCSSTEFGCCPDGVSAAIGSNFAGCVDLECEGSGPCDSCEDTPHGCCPDGFTAAQGDNFMGCPEPEDETTTTSYSSLEPLTTTTSTTTTTTPIDLLEDCAYSNYGCCPDGYTAAHGPDNVGCCLASAFGCCPDHITESQGPNMQGCGCEFSAYGCCPDNQTVARGANNAGCGCLYTEFGCCPDSHTPAAGKDYSGCACNTYPHGCCFDGVSIAKGPDREGCGCAYEEFGCCEDDRTPATGPNFEGCGCEASKFGCCPDGVTPATSKFFDGCEEESPVVPGEVCGHEKDRGSCTNFTVKWFFDMEYGGCARFWYGGCGGNLNKFESVEQCTAACVEPEGMEACHLPRVKGPCSGSVPSWYHDSETGSCKSFVYGDCLGNNNRFASKDECEKLCVIPQVTDVCLLELLPGPCRGNYSRWHYDQTTGNCHPFTYGGCKGNGNNFLTENECMQQCVRGRSKDLCTLPKASGLCDETLPRWYYDYSETRCMPFYYTGCDGNVNRFITRGECEGVCPGDIKAPAEEVCSLPNAPGDCDNYETRWYYDAVQGSCNTFVYGGCGGNGNNFASASKCENYCSHKGIIEEEEFQLESCFLEQDQGKCEDFQAYWYYNSTNGVCHQFLFGGCGGNENRFKSGQECENKCGDALDICQLPRVVGPCAGSFRQYYYDSSSDQCYEFDYGGCQGNKNRFDSLHHCQQRCKRTQDVLTTTEPPYHPDIDNTIPESIEGDVSDVCQLPVSIGPCRAAIPQWYYDENEGRCVGFSYGGCQGNANRFSSVEQCERRCGRYHDEDVCKLRFSPGPCNEQIHKWYHDPYDYERACKPFSYGGCEGNGNRFSTERECEAECVYHDTILPEGTNTEETNTLVCENKVDPGPCAERYKRWHFSKEHGKCEVFLYSGCGGNRNRFKKHSTCTEFCTAAIDKYRGSVSTDAPQEVTLPVVDQDTCRDALLACQVLQCPYGIQRRVDESGCDQCSCYDPCTQVTCSNGTQCAIELIRSITNPGQSEYQAFCREINKPGRCPKTSGQTYDCEDECSNDAECYDNNKCCYDGCGYSCLAPQREEAEAGYTNPPLVTTPEQGPTQPARIVEFNDNVSSEENDVVELKCVARGQPQPTITWYRGEYQIDTESGSSRFRVLPTGSLQIVNTEQSDAGNYVCEANNGAGNPDRRTAVFEITEPTPREAAVVPWNPPEPVATLGSPAVLYCRAVGWPRPQVTWWRGNDMVPFSLDQYEQHRDGSLTIRVVKIRNLGPYTCHVYNGKGRAISDTIILRAYGPLVNTLVRDQQFLKYLVSPPKAPPTTPPPTSTTAFPAIRPDQRPYRPPYFLGSTISSSVTTLAPTTTTSRAYIVPVSARIQLNSTEFMPSSSIYLPCEVRGFPTPITTWYKEDQEIHESEKFKIEDDQTLVISDAQVDDSGLYKCQVKNQFGTDDSTITITVRGVYVHPLCTDNPFFAKCSLIVQAQYCTNRYYARFCCRSCTLAGQLPSIGPHLKIPATDTDSSKRK